MHCELRWRDVHGVWVESSDQWINCGRMSSLLVHCLSPISAHMLAASLVSATERAVMLFTQMQTNIIIVFSCNRQHHAVISHCIISTSLEHRYRVYATFNFRQDSNRRTDRQLVVIVFLGVISARWEAGGLVVPRCIHGIDVSVHAVGRPLTSPRRQSSGFILPDIPCLVVDTICQPSLYSRVLTKR